MTHAIPIPARPAIIPSATYLRPEILATYENLNDVPYRLQGMDTAIVYIGPTGDVFRLNGPGAGDQGVRLDKNLQGEHHWPFEQVITEGAYQMGATIERTNILRRRINLRVRIGAPGMNNITYRACEEHWWANQDEELGGWLGVFTRFSGLRWIPVWPEKTVDTTQQNDPVMYGNNSASWDLNWIAPIPYYSKPSVLSKAWRAVNAGDPDEDGFYHGTIAVPNSGDISSYVEFLVNGSGRCIVQDNQSDRTVPVDILPEDGQVVIDTDPTHKTLLAENDPHDDLLAKQLRAAGLLNSLLSTKNNGSAGEPIWLRQYVRFLYVTPPKSVVHLHVAHNNPQAEIVVKLTQRFKRSR